MTHDAPILVIGGTRGTGCLIARRLRDQGSAVRILARDPAAAVERLGSSFEIVHGDITQPPTLPPAIAGTQHIVFTAGCRSGHPVGEREIKRTEFEGVSNTLAAASSDGFRGRFLYMTSSGVHSRSFWTIALNIYKGNTLAWRARAESLIRDSGLAYTIIRTGVLLNAVGGRHEIDVTQQELPLSPRHRIARADVASVFVAALTQPRAERATFEITWRKGAGPWREALDRLERDGSR